MIEYTVKVSEYKTEWRLDGKLHRVDGPAIEWANGNKSWYLNGRRVSEEEVNAKTQIKELTVTQLEEMLGYKIKVVGE